MALLRDALPLRLTTPGEEFRQEFNASRHDRTWLAVIHGGQRLVPRDDAEGPLTLIEHHLTKREIDRRQSTPAPSVWAFNLSRPARQSGGQLGASATSPCSTAAQMRTTSHGGVFHMKSNKKAAAARA